MTQLIDGKKVAAEMKEKIAREIAVIQRERGEKVGLAVVLVGSDPASEVYVRLKKKDCAEVGVTSFGHDLPAETTETELLALIDRLNNDSAVAGILVQLPLPDHIDEAMVLRRIDPEKDVDGFHPVNTGLLSQNQATLVPCTPAGSVELLDRYNIPIEGANAVVLGRSNIVGKPVAIMLLNRSATVTVCHSRTKNLAAITAQADILIAAIGKAKFVTANMVKEGATIIDVGTNRMENGKLCGDVDFDAVYDKVGAISPSPGGVGPMTRALLLKNTLVAYKAQRNV